MRTCPSWAAPGLPQLSPPSLNKGLETLGVCRLHELPKATGPEPASHLFSLSACSCVYTTLFSLMHIPRLAQYTSSEMFMEILYKQTALFPLSSCRDRARVTFFIDRLKHRAVPPPHPGGSVTSPPTLPGPGVLQWEPGLPTLARAGIPSRSLNLFPKPASRQRVLSSAGGFVQVREAGREEKGI